MVPLLVVAWEKSTQQFGFNGYSLIECSASTAESELKKLPKKADVLTFDESVWNALKTGTRKIHKLIWIEGLEDGSNMHVLWDDGDETEDFINAPIIFGAGGSSLDTAPVVWKRYEKEITI